MKKIKNVDQVINDLVNNNSKIKKWERQYQKEKFIIDFIAKTRNENSISQKELADKIGIKQPALSRVERHLNSPQLNTVIAIFDELGYSFEIVKNETNEKMQMYTIDKSCFNNNIVTYEMEESKNECFKLTNKSEQCHFA